MTVRQAILYNVLSAMMAYLGMITGILIGHYAANISMWIFALTAGLFMYVALVDMVSQRLLFSNEILSFPPHTEVQTSGWWTDCGPCSSVLSPCPHRCERITAEALGCTVLPSSGRCLISPKSSCKQIHFFLLAEVSLWLVTR